MKQIYLDNGSTSFPKAPGLGKAVGEHIDQNGYNISRGGYEKAYNLEDKIIDTRELLCSMFGFEKAANIVFNSGATAGLNLLINGMLKPGDHIITTSMEHNAVVRPITALQKIGVEWDEAKCGIDGKLDPASLEMLIRPETKLVMAIHGSNVCGTLIPIKKIGEICKKHDVFFAVDASQTAGSVPINMKDMKVDALIVPGHKGLMGPQGIGAVMLCDDIAEELEPMTYGGTGSLSDSETMPYFMPDKFQPGTLNIPGIIGLKHSIEFIRTEGLSSIACKKKHLTEMFISEVRNMKNIRLIGTEESECRCAVVSLDFEMMDNAEASYILESRFGIMTRCGLHCAPHAHKTLETFPQGTVRFSFGYFNSEADVKSAIDAINFIVKSST